MGKEDDSVINDILKEARELQSESEKKEEVFDQQSSILEGFESGTTTNVGNGPGKAKLIRKLNLFSHQYAPLIPTRVYGRNDRVPILNLTGALRNHIVYSAANNIILYDYVKDQQIILPGHKNKIVTLAKDRRNKVFASGDWGPRSTVIIWDVFSGNPYQALPLEDIHRSNGICCLDFAGRIPYIGLLGAEKYNKQAISIWPYETHRNVPKLSSWTLVPAKAGYQHQIIFHPDNYQFFATTGFRSVIFYTWCRSERKITSHTPKIPKPFLTRIEKFTQSLWSFSEDSCLLTATMSGYVVVWDMPSPVGLVEPPDPSKNVMECKRCYKISTTGLTTFVQHNGLYVIGDDKGIVRFFDYRFHLLRYTNNHHLPPIYSLAFNELEAQPPEFQRVMQNNYDRDGRNHAHKEKQGFIRDYTLGMNYFHQPSEVTIERNPFQCPDFFVGVAHGNMYYHHLAEERLDIIVHGANSRFVGCDFNQVSNHLALVTFKGEMHLYEVSTHKMISRIKLFKQNLRVSCVKFHPTGAYMFIGTTRGKIFLRRCYNWKPLDAPLDNARAWISGIIFSSDGLYMAHYDKSRAIGLYVYIPRKNTWLFKGKQRIHCKKVVDVLFFQDNSRNYTRLFSLGEDRRIIEYDIPNSSVGGGLKALTVTRIEQFSVPRAMAFAEPFPGMKSHIIISNSQFKMSVYDIDARIIRRTVQGPAFGTPIHKMVSIIPEGYKIGGRVFTLICARNKIGFAKPPLDGNPFKFMAILAHPTGVRSVTLSFDHKTIYTIGRDETVGIQWAPNLPAVERGTVMGGSGISPFLQMLDRDMPSGKSLVTEAQNCFYMLMLQKVLCTKDLLTSEMRILVKEIPSVVRFCGYFPTEYEIDLMIEEAEYAGVIEHGERNSEITFDEFIKLFANHRRYPQHTRATYANAFRTLAKVPQGDAIIRGVRLKRILINKGEKISDVDLPIYIPSFYKSIVRYRYESSHQGLRGTTSGRDKGKKKKVIRKEIYDKIDGRSFLDKLYSRSVPLPMTWRRDSVGRGKLNSILSHLTKQKTVYDSFPAMGGVAGEASNNANNNNTTTNNYDY